MQLLILMCVPPMRERERENQKSFHYSSLHFFSLWSSGVSKLTPNILKYRSIIQVIMLDPRINKKNFFIAFFTDFWLCFKYSWMNQYYCDKRIHWVKSWEIIFLLSYSEIFFFFYRIRKFIFLQKKNYIVF